MIIIIRDLDPETGFLAVDFIAILHALEQEVDALFWQIGPVRNQTAEIDELEFFGKFEKQISQHVSFKSVLSYQDLLKLVDKNYQSIWIELNGFIAKNETRSVIAIRVIDSSFVEVETKSEAIANKLKYIFKVVEIL